MKLKNLINIKRQINKPEYYFNPTQLIKRLAYKNKGRIKVAVKIDDLNQPFYVNENEVIGSAILSQGVYDLVVAECIKRIINPGDTFVDVGANIGYFTRQALSNGAKTFSFEPHPNIFKRLSENLDQQNDSSIFQMALSDQKGEFTLYIPENFDKNEGIASLNPMPNSKEIKVQTETLDQKLNNQIRLLKIDVEGHEESVLKGAKTSIEAKRIDYIVFEDFEGMQSKTINFLEKNNYKVYRLHKTLFGPKLLSVKEGLNIPAWEPPNYISSYDSTELKNLFSSSGWKHLRSN